MNLKKAWEEAEALEKLRKENGIDPDKVLEKLLKAMEIVNTETDKKLEELADCCKDKDLDVR